MEDILSRLYTLYSGQERRNIIILLVCTKVINEIIIRCIVFYGKLLSVL